MTVNRKVLTMHRQNLAIHSSRKCVLLAPGRALSPQDALSFLKKRFSSLISRLENVSSRSSLEAVPSP